MEALGDAPVDLVTGDLGLVLAAIDALATSAARKAALRRHVWRPARFHALLERFGEGHAAARARRAELLAAEAEGRTLELVAAAGAAVGLRGAEEVAARVARLAEEAATPPLDGRGGGRIEAVLAVAGRRRAAVGRLRALARGLPGPRRGGGPASRRGSTRCAARGIAPEALRFEASFGRTSLEYYDGLVFGALPRGRGDLPAIASGGRYDALTRVLGQGRGIPAVGGMIRPEALVALVGGGHEARGAVEGPAAGRDDRLVRGARGDGGAERRRAGVSRARCAGVEGIELVLLSAGEIPRELAAGRLHLGVTGQDLVREEIPRWGERLAELAPMGFGFADLVVAVPAFWIDVADMADLDAAAAEFRARHGHRLRVATKYHHLVREFFRVHGVADYQLVDSQGATEGAVKNLTAEAVADITTTGSTLRDNHLRVLADGVILRSQATLFLARGAAWDRAAETALAGLCARGSGCNGRPRLQRAAAAK